MFSYSKALLFSPPRGSLNFGPACESHTYYGEVPGRLYCVTGHLNLPASYHPWAVTAQPAVAEGEVRSSHQAAVQLCWMALLWLPFCLLLWMQMGRDLLWSQIPSGRRKGEYL